MGMNLKVGDMDKVARTIHVGGVGGLGDEIKEADMAEFFNQYGEVTAVRISGRFAWVEFGDVRAANASLALDGESTGGHHLRVSQSKSAIHSNGLTRRSSGGAPAQAEAPPSIATTAPPVAARPAVPTYGAYPPPVAGPAPLGPPAGPPQHFNPHGYPGGPPFPPQQYNYGPPPHGYGPPQGQGYGGYAPPSPAFNGGGYLQQPYGPPGAYPPPGGPLPQQGGYGGAPQGYGGYR